MAFFGRKMENGRILGDFIKRTVIGKAPPEIGAFIGRDAVLSGGSIVKAISEFYIPYNGIIPDKETPEVKTILKDVSLMLGEEFLESPVMRPPILDRIDREAKGVIEDAIREGTEAAVSEEPFNYKDFMSIIEKYPAQDYDIYTTKSRSSVEHYFKENGYVSYSNGGINRNYSAWLDRYLRIDPVENSSLDGGEWRLIKVDVIFVKHTPVTRMSMGKYDMIRKIIPNSKITPGEFIDREFDFDICKFWYDGEIVNCLVNGFNPSAVESVKNRTFSFSFHNLMTMNVHKKYTTMRRILKYRKRGFSFVCDPDVLYQYFLRFIHGSMKNIIRRDFDNFASFDGRMGEFTFDGRRQSCHENLKKRLQVIHSICERQIPRILQDIARVENSWRNYDPEEIPKRMYVLPETSLEYKILKKAYSRTLGKHVVWKFTIPNEKINPKSVFGLCMIVNPDVETKRKMLNALETFFYNSDQAAENLLLRMFEFPVIRKVLDTTTPGMGIPGFSLMRSRMRQIDPFFEEKFYKNAVAYVTDTLLGKMKQFEQSKAYRSMIAGLDTEEANRKDLSEIETIHTGNIRYAMKIFPGKTEESIRADVEVKKRKEMLWEAPIFAKEDRKKRRGRSEDDPEDGDRKDEGNSDDENLEEEDRRRGRDDPDDDELEDRKKRRKDEGNSEDEAPEDRRRGRDDPEDDELEQQRRRLQ